MNYYKPYLNRILKGNSIKYITPLAPIRNITVYGKNYRSWYDYMSDYCTLESYIRRTLISSM